jgi:hypothetical protein
VEVWAVSQEGWEDNATDSAELYLCGQFD